MRQDADHDCHRCDALSMAVALMIGALVGILVGMPLGVVFLRMWQ